MPKSTPSFILELPLRTKPADERECGIILRASQNIYNAGAASEGFARTTAL
jgi:hypothetical protein